MIWLTRDTLPDGNLAPWVDEWDIEPIRVTDVNPNGAVWVSRFQDIRGRTRALSVEECRREYMVVPETDREMIAVGRKKR
jgi:hypothetical protein